MAEGRRDYLSFPKRTYAGSKHFSTKSKRLSSISCTRLNPCGDLFFSSRAPPPLRSESPPESPPCSPPRCRAAGR